MIRDKLDFFTVATAAGGQTDKELIGPGTSSTQQNTYSEYRDLGAVGAMDGSRKKYLILEGVSALTGGTYAITLENDDDGAGTNLATALTLVAASGNVAATTRLKVPLPEGLKKFIRIKAAASAATGLGAGLFKVFLAMS